MSDLLAPLLAVMENEVDTFWCFVGFMDTVVSRHTYMYLNVPYREIHVPAMKIKNACLQDYRESYSHINFKFLYIPHSYQG